MITLPNNSRFVRLFALFVLTFTVSTFAQEGGWTSGNRLIIQGGLTNPVANFGALPAALQDLIPAEGRTPLGGANLGFTVGLNNVYRFTPNFALSISADANYNTFNNEEAARQLRNGILATSINGINLAPLSGLLGLTTSYAAQAYINGTLTGGLRYDLPVIAGLVNVYANAQAGLFYGILPQSEAKLGVNIPLLFQLDATITRAQATATAFAYKLGAGILLFDRINVGLNYVAATPSFIVNTTPVANVRGVQGSVPLPGLGNVSTQTIINAVVGTVPVNSVRYDFPTNVLQVTVGYAF
ncbi:MAG: hypothetical protein MUF71_17840 [Candidatus Kapabacteria bacterium]|jgi:hypothetical protein|nr:hypothetical protein [Candidatus Kapabacteria bacterium]